MKILYNVVALCLAYIANSNALLTHYWPIVNSQINDFIGNANMPLGTTKFIADRFGVNNSALSLNGGYTSAPSGFYFDTPQFSLSLWVYPNMTTPTGLLDFGSNPLVDNIILFFDTMSTIRLRMYLNTNLVVDLQSLVQYNQWNFVTVTFDGIIVTMYVNASLTNLASGVTGLYTDKAVVRSVNYIGKCNLPATYYSYSYVDDIRFYNTSMTQADILELMLLDEYSSKYQSLTLLLFIFTQLKFGFLCQ